MSSKKIGLFIVLFLFGLVVSGSANEIEINVKGTVYDQNSDSFLDFSQIPSRIKALIEAVPEKAEYESEVEYSARIQPYDNKLLELYDSEYNITLTPEHLSSSEEAEFYRFVLQFPFPIYRKDNFMSTQSLEYIYEVPSGEIKTIAGKINDMKVKLYFKILRDNTVSITKAILLFNNKKMRQWE
jgi:hypothetical protein